MKKVFKKLFTVMMVFVFTIVANAASDGSITIQNSAANTDVTYIAYKLLNMSYNEKTESVAYTINPTWAEFFDRDDIKALITMDSTGIYVVGIKDDSEANAKLLAEKAIAYATTNNIDADAKIALSYAKANPSAISAIDTVTANSTTVTFDDLDLGYYLVDSTLGALVHLDSTNKSATIVEKNGEPKIEKEELDEYISRVSEEKEQVNKELTSLLAEHKEIAEKINSYRDQKQQQEIRLARNETQLENAKQKLWDDFEISYAQALQYRKEDFVLSTAQKEAREIRVRMDELGDVNVGAISEYESIYWTAAGQPV